MTNTNCRACNSSRLTTGVLSGASVEPKGGTALIDAMTRVELSAKLCLECGHVDLHADPARLKGLAALG